MRGTSATLTTMPNNLSRQAATSPDDYSLTIEEVALRYEHAGHPRTARSIQRYCAQGHLDCLRQETPFGEKYLITPASVARHIAQIEEITRATSRDMSRPVALNVSDSQSRDIIQPEPATGHDESRRVATNTTHEELDKAERHSPTQPDVSQYVARLESENVFLRDQIGVKDTQIAALLERDKETNFLIRGLQTMLAPLLGSADKSNPTQHHAN